MNRRKFCTLVALTACTCPLDLSAAVLLISTDKKKKLCQDNNWVRSSPLVVAPQNVSDNMVRDYLVKIRHPDLPHPNDVYLDADHAVVLARIVSRFKRLYRTMGYGNFGVAGFDKAVCFARNYSVVGRFTGEELDFLEMIYYRNANDYGFYGDKRIVALTQEIKIKDTYKVPYSGNCLFKGASLSKYQEIKRNLGEDVLLTSGIRGLIKQFYLYLNKVERHGGNLSLASRSLAPPGYSYHGTGDFDIGQMGFGKNNFSEKFIGTPVFKKLTALGYVEFRYRRDNLLGVRYEPWHVKL
ncbi:MAG: peptidase M15 [Desulfotalea sp.]|nr:MAG: peptidase M15 [Desulfotalea sp.]